MSVTNILIDTNFLISCILFKIDMLNEARKACDFNFKLCLLDKSLLELENISNRKELTSKERQAALLSIKFIEKFNLEILNTEGTDYVDDVLAKCQKDDVVATNDKELIGRLAKKDIRVLRIKQKKYFYLE